MKENLDVFFNSACYTMMQNVGKGKEGRRPVWLKAKKYKRSNKRETIELFLFSSRTGGAGGCVADRSGTGGRDVTSLVPFMGHAY